MVAKICLDSPPTLGAMGIPRHGEASSSDTYLLPDHWCFHIYSYRATLQLDGESHQIKPGDASLIPSGTRMTYRYYGPSEHVYFHFKPGLGTRFVKLPMVLSLGELYDDMDRRARIAIIRSNIDPAYSIATLWALLWEFSSRWDTVHDGRVDRYHPLVVATIQHIEQRLGEPLSVKLLSNEIGVSYGYLSRLFRQELGMPVSTYIRDRRAEHAAHLLSSTTLPIKVIARTVGVPNLQLFNRFMHEMKGVGPRALRRDHGFPRPFVMKDHEEKSEVGLAG